MLDKPQVTDVEFRLVDDRLRIPVKRTLFCAAYVAACAFAAYTGNDAGMSAAMVCLAGLVWPLVRFFSMVAEKVSSEQETLLRERMIRDASPRRRLLRLLHQSR